MPALFPAKIFTKTVGGNDDKTLILTTRSQMVLPFQAPNWTDLRVGFFLSVCSLAGDDTITTLGEIITNPGSPDGLGPQDRYWIGLKDRGAALPKNPESVFVGFSNASPADHTIEPSGNSRLTSSDLGITATNVNFWRPNNSENQSRSGGIWQGFHNRFISGDGVQQHFVQTTAGAGGYATLLALRITRPDKDSKRLTARVPHIAQHSADVLFTDTPTLALLKATLQAFPATVQQWNGTLLSVPDALYLYWPFNNSRLRCHALGIFSHTKTKKEKNERCHIIRPRQHCAGRERLPGRSGRSPACC
jgi:hypothetical protein